MDAAQRQERIGENIKGVTVFTLIRGTTTIFVARDIKIL